MREFGLMGVFIRDIGLIWNESRRTKNNVKPADVLLLHKKPAGVHIESDNEMVIP